MKLSNKLQILLFFIVFVIIPFYFSLYPIRTYAYWDESVYLQHSEIFYSGRMNYSELEFRPPLLSIVLAASYVFWHSIITARIVMAMFLVGSGLMFFLLFRQVYGRKVGLLATLLFFYNPFIIKQSHFILSDIPALFFILVSLYFYFKKSKYNLWFVGFFAGLAILTRFTSLIVLLLFIMLFYFNKDSIRNMVTFFSALFLTLLPYLLWAQLKFGFFLHPFIKARGFVQLYDDPFFFYLSNFMDYITIWILIAILLYLLVFVYCLSKKKGNFKFDIIFLLWSLVFLLYMSYLPHKEIRYIIPLFVILILMAAKGYNYMFNIRKGKYFWACFIVLFILCSPPVFELRTHYTYDYALTRGELLGIWVKSNLVDDKPVFTNLDFPIMAYYSGRRIVGVYPQDEYFYSNISLVMYEPGYFIYGNPDIHPTKDFLDTDERFKLYDSIDEKYHVYEFDPFSNFE
ncbi:glycosyltransferase family 39 protein [Candidatus Woesearchaeota archaeon]|nr:glycosyltransferase family 39 protein [Candidatus Woesearchaeota archaeon]